jgi:hypothetical protein
LSGLLQKCEKLALKRAMMPGRPPLEPFDRLFGHLPNVKRFHTSSILLALRGARGKW